MHCSCRTENGLPCKNGAISPSMPLCSIHYKLAGTCRCKTANGKRCKNKIHPSYAPYCSQAHKNGCDNGEYNTCSRPDLPRRVAEKTPLMCMAAVSAVYQKMEQMKRDIQLISSTNTCSSEKMQILQMSEKVDEMEKELHQVKEVTEREKQVLRDEIEQMKINVTSIEEELKTAQSLSVSVSDKDMEIQMLEQKVKVCRDKLLEKEGELREKEIKADAVSEEQMEKITMLEKEVVLVKQKINENDEKNNENSKMLEYYKMALERSKRLLHHLDNEIQDYFITSAKEGTLTQAMIGHLDTAETIANTTEELQVIEEKHDVAVAAVEAAEAVVAEKQIALTNATPEQQPILQAKIEEAEQKVEVAEKIADAIVEKHNELVQELVEAHQGHVVTATEVHEEVKAQLETIQMEHDQTAEKLTRLQEESTDIIATLASMDVTNPETKQKLVQDIERSNTMLEQVQADLKKKEIELEEIEQVVEATASNVDFVTDNSQAVVLQLNEAKQELAKETQEVVAALAVGQKELELVQQNQVESGAIVELEKEKQQDLTAAQETDVAVNNSVVAAEMEDLDAPIDPNLTAEQRIVERNRRYNKKKKLRQKASRAAKKSGVIVPVEEGKRKRRSHKKVNKKSPNKHNKKQMSHKKGKKRSHKRV